MFPEAVYDAKRRLPERFEQSAKSLFFRQARANPARTSAAWDSALQPAGRHLISSCTGGVSTSVHRALSRAPCMTCGEGQVSIRPTRSHARQSVVFEGNCPRSGDRSYRVHGFGEYLQGQVLPFSGLCTHVRRVGCESATRTRSFIGVSAGAPSASFGRFRGIEIA